MTSEVRYEAFVAEDEVVLGGEELGSVGRSAADGAGLFARRALAVMQTGYVIGFRRLDVGGVIPSMLS